jgi:hypothetical protein
MVLEYVPMGSLLELLQLPNNGIEQSDIISMYVS